MNPANKTRQKHENTSALGYIRVSTQEQATQGVSLDAQRERIKAYCLMSGLDLVDVIADEGVSGTVSLADREGGRQLTQTVEKRNSPVTHVVALKLDRLFRDAGNALEQTKAWDKAGITLHLIDMGGTALSSTGAVGRMMLTMMAAFAELERNLIAERTTAAMRHMKRNKAVYSPTPLGFTRNGDALVSNLNEMNTVTRIQTLRTDGATLGKIADTLNSEQVPTKQGGSWFPSTVSYILKNDLYKSKT